MKFFRLIFIALIFCNLNMTIAQERENRKYREHYPILVRPTNHDPNFVKTTEKSFYQEKNGRLQRQIYNSTRQLMLYKIRRV